MIIVADTSPLNYLILIDRISILETLYRRIMVPRAVHEEMPNLVVDAISKPTDN